MRRQRLILAAVLTRIAIALATQTFFQPDEYFQSLEVAHRLVFAYGHLTWEWLSPRPIRSILYPLLNVPIYFALKATRLDDTRLLIWGPKILHGALAALTDVAVCRLCENVLGQRYVSAAFAISVTSLFHGLSLSRSMSNSLETSLTALALSFFPWETSPSVSTWRGQFRASLALAALACAVRPTNVVIWVYMLLLLAYQLRGHFEKLRSVILDSAAICLAAVALLCGLDSLYYGKLTLTPLNFVLTNLSSVSLFYGSSPWHYYLTQGIPILCTTALPFVLHGSWLCLGPTSTTPARQLLGLVAWCIAVYSLAGHKEWRFLHPILPVMHLFAAKSLVDLYTRPASRKASKDTQRMLPIRTGHLCLLLVNIPLLFYLAQLHGRAQIDVMHYFRALPDDGVRSVGFLMPCHSTPWQAYLHKPTFADTYRFWSLGCEPPLESQVIQDYKDQTDVFYDSPITYLRTRFPSRVDMAFPPSPYPCSHPGVPQNATTNDWRHEWPQYIVAFGALIQEEGVSEMFEDMGYKMVWRRNRGWEGDERRRGGIMVLKVD